MLEKCVQIYFEKYFIPEIYYPFVLYSTTTKQRYFSERIINCMNNQIKIWSSFTKSFNVYNDAIDND